MKFLNPQKIISQSVISPGFSVADFGFGNGTILRYLSKEVGEEGKVFAIDIQSDLVKKISDEFKTDGINNTVFANADLEKENSTSILENSLDFILISSVLFQSQKKDKIIEEAFRILKTGGRLLVID
jgi:ubiquinone/menaquinone biosynthesis C-methylase UbiE